MDAAGTGRAVNGEIELYYETFGEPVEGTLVLVNGLGSQLISFPPEFCRLFVDLGFQVIRFDNRDVGLSTKTPGKPPSIPSIIGAPRQDREAMVPYTLSDMASDVVAVLDAVAASEAHLWGMSMGGMIVQTVASEHPHRVASLTSVMSSTGNPKVGGATPEAMKVLTTPPPTDRDGAIAHGVHSREVISGSYYDPVTSQVFGEAAHDRCFHPVGTAFQLAAITAAGNRTPALANVVAPTMVIHGRLDPLIDLSGGAATAEAIAGAELVILDDMGHDIPEPLWESYAELFARLVGAKG
jgi:pimeloyl-ACP methyl ester carboxylesterase